MAKRTKLKLLQRGGGCGFLLSTCLVACVALLFNSMIVSVFEVPVRLIALRFMHDKYAYGVSGGFVFVGPVLLLILQWWILDTLVDVFGREKMRDSAK